jgi:hypothetical protein
MAADDFLLWCAAALLATLLVVGLMRLAVWCLTRD